VTRTTLGFVELDRRSHAWQIPIVDRVGEPVLGVQAAQRTVDLNRHQLPDVATHQACNLASPRPARFPSANDVTLPSRKAREHLRFYRHRDRVPQGKLAGRFAHGLAAVRVDQ